MHLEVKEINAECAIGFQPIEQMHIRIFAFVHTEIGIDMTSLNCLLLVQMVAVTDRHQTMKLVSQMLIQSGPRLLPND